LKLTGLGIGAAAVMTTTLAGCGQMRAPLAGPRWMEHARLGGEAFYIGYGDVALDRTLDRLAESGASVLEGDANMSDFLDDTALAQTLDEIHYVTQKAHERNLKVVWYYPSLEVITPNGEHQSHSMFKKKPTWVQYNIGDKPNVFYGSKEHWVDPGAESAWMCHNSPYRDYYFDRVRWLEVVATYELEDAESNVADLMIPNHRVMSGLTVQY
jgi:hypothetical protein